MHIFRQNDVKFMEKISFLYNHDLIQTLFRMKNSTSSKDYKNCEELLGLRGKTAYSIRLPRSSTENFFRMPFSLYVTR